MQTFIIVVLTCIGWVGCEILAYGLLKGFFSRLLDTGLEENSYNAQTDCMLYAASNLGPITLVVGFVLIVYASIKERQNLIAVRYKLPEEYYADWDPYKY